MSQLSIFRLLAMPFAKYSHQAFKRNTQMNEKLFAELYQQKILPLFKPKTEEDQYSQKLKNSYDFSIYLNTDLNEFDHQFVSSSLKNSSIYPDVSSKAYRPNYINNRIKKLQYAANNPNEDTLIHQQLKSINAYTASIFDGHGGNQLSEFAKDRVNFYIDAFISQNKEKQQYLDQEGRQKLFIDSIKWSYQKIQDTFFEFYEDQMRRGNTRIQNVGTCGITAIVHGDRAFIGNSGDSQSIFIVETKSDFVYIKGNERLSVNLKSERDRIRNEFDGIQKNVIADEGKNTFYLKGRLQPTRTIGDYYLKKQKYYSGGGVFNGPYLSCVPDVAIHRLNSDCKHLVLASDGVWDVLKKREVVKLLMTQQDLSSKFNSEEDKKQIQINKILQQILQRSADYFSKTLQELKVLKQGDRRDFHDDISIVLINLKNQI